MECVIKAFPYGGGGCEAPGGGTCVEKTSKYERKNE